MAVSIIIVGLFLWFSLAFNGGFSIEFINYSFFISGFFMVISGVSSLLAKPNISHYSGFFALCFYLPMIWQRFFTEAGIDWAGFIIDTLIMVFLILYITTNKKRIIAPI